MTAEILATGKCGECGHERAQLKATHKGAPYRYCPVCKAQYFPRRSDAQERLCRAFGIDPAVIDGAPVSSRVRGAQVDEKPPAIAEEKTKKGWLNDW